MATRLGIAGAVVGFAAHRVLLQGVQHLLIFPVIQHLFQIIERFGREYCFIQQRLSRGGDGLIALLFLNEFLIIGKSVGIEQAQAGKVAQYQSSSPVGHTHHLRTHEAHAGIPDHQLETQYLYFTFC